MLRVEFNNAANTTTMRIEGRMVGVFAEEARALAARCKIPQALVVDVSEVTFVDAAGEEVLSWLGQIGGEFVAESCYSRDVCEYLHLPLTRKCLGSSFPRHAQTFANCPKAIPTDSKAHPTK